MQPACSSWKVVAARGTSEKSPFQRLRWPMLLMILALRPAGDRGPASHPSGRSAAGRAPEAPLHPTLQPAGYSEAKIRQHDPNLKDRSVFPARSHCMKNCPSPSHLGLPLTVVRNPSLCTWLCCQHPVSVGSSGTISSRITKCILL